MPAEGAAPFGPGVDIAFNMEGAEVRTGQTSIDVLADRGIGVVRFGAYDCVKVDGEYSEVESAHPTSPRIWKTSPPPAIIMS